MTNVSRSEIELEILHWLIELTLRTHVKGWSVLRWN